MEHIYNLAKAFRAAIEKTPRNSFHTTLAFSKFPDACCDDASLLLAAYLSDNGYTGSVRVHGANGGTSEELKSHVWLLYSELIVDITADQFAKYEMAPVIVAIETDFHKAFEIQSAEPADFREKFARDPKWLSYFNSDYETILSQLDRSQ